MEYITMRNGTKVPMLGLGCYKSEEQEGVEAVKSAISCGSGSEDGGGG
jgi:diketogulonate reductase-like aldo/keto reductase